MMSKLHSSRHQLTMTFNKVIEFEPGYSPPLQDRITEYLTQLPSELMHVRGQLLKLPSIEAVIAETEAEAQLLCLASENKDTAATAAGAVGRAGGKRGRAGRARGSERSGRGKPRDKPSADDTRRTKYKRSARIVRHTVNLACTPKRTAGSYTPKRKRLTIRLTGNERKMKKRNRRG